MKLFNTEISLTKENSEPVTIVNYGEYIKQKMLQLLLIGIIYIALFYSFSFFFNELDKLHQITPTALIQ